MTNSVAPTVIEASPTKDFFIDMLVKDIGLNRSIVDLVDNSVDGARRMREGGDYSGLTVRIDATPKHFTITDNCGGIDVDTARKYAFRFGRPKEMPQRLHSVSEFGVGMKRALFKLGARFRIESRTRVSRFVVEVDVDQWKQTDEWKFEFRELEEVAPEVGPDETGTKILVDRLHETVRQSFSLENLQTRLREEIQAAHLLDMAAGLEITHNGLPLQIRTLELLHSDRLKPAKEEFVLGKPSDSPLKALVYAGISESKPSEAGWYIFCNGRQVLGADQTGTTGWGEGGEKTIPRYHNQFAMFRGYTFFDADDAGLLPWNTTKTGVDEDSPAFRAVRLNMIRLMRPVIDFLNRLKEEKEEADKKGEETDEQPLEAEVNRAQRVRISTVSTSATFLAPKPRPVPRMPRTGRIQYSKPLDEINEAKKALKARTFVEVGEKTFDYFFKRECED